jgi:hypothetical protein
MGVLIHAQPAIAWHGPFAQKMQAGLRAIGITAGVTSSRARESDTAILLGTTMWRSVEATGDFLLVDRCSFGDTRQWVSLVWNGHGRRGNHCVPDDRGNRWERIGVPVQPWRTGSRVVLCGQTETYSPDWPSLTDWYRTVRATHFRPHPAADNPTGLPTVRTFDDTALAITLNSSVGVDAAISGVKVLAMDAGSMAWDISAQQGDRTDWLRWLAWTQWHHDEIAAGEPIKHLFEGM